MILKGLVVSPFATNCYIVGSEKTKEGMIIDPGDNARQILETVKELGLKIKLIVLTHGHVDHAGALSEVEKTTGAELRMHPDDLRFIQGNPFTNPPGPSQPPTPSHEQYLNDGDSIDVSDLHFLIIHTPGHSPGSICLFGHGILFSGDTLFNYSIGRSDLPGGSHHQLIDSLHSRLMMLPDDTVVYPGHGPETTIGTERQTNPFLRGNP
ncbi:MBL fold metallo-hydrolase [Chloroflexota bacterium]